MPVTIKDIADSAGVAPSTVSRVLNQSGYVSAAARARVEKAIDELQYQPSWVARSLRGKPSGLVGLIIPDILNVYYTSVARSILENLSKKGYNLIIQVTNEDSDLEQAYLRTLSDRKVDGIIYVPVADGHNSAFVHDLVCKGMPMIELSRQREADILDAVLADNFGGSYMAVERLRQLGHRRIAVIGGSMNSSTARDRFLGYKKALEDTGVMFDSALAKMLEASKGWGIQATRELLQLESVAHRGVRGQQSDSGGCHDGADRAQSQGPGRCLHHLLRRFRLAEFLAAADYDGGYRGGRDGYAGRSTAVEAHRRGQGR